MSLRAAVRKAAQLLGVTNPTRFGKKHTRDPDDVDLPLWDVPNPFAPPDPDPDLARLRALVQAEIAHTARYESIGPLDRHDPSDDEGDGEDEDDGDDEGDGKDEDDDEDEDNDGDDGDEDEDEDEDGDDESMIDDGQSESDDDKPPTIALPRLLPIPLRFVPSTHTLATPTSHIFDDDERARKAKRDAYRSRSKALAILGPEAVSAL